MTVRHILAAALVLVLAAPGAAFAARGDLGASSQEASFSINAYSWLNKYHMDIGGTNLGNTLNDLATGKQPDIHRTMIAMEKASISFEMLMQIRNKVISAYDKIMRMPI